MSLVFWLMSCDGSKTIWFKGYVESTRVVRLTTSVVYETAEGGEKVEKRQRFTVWPNGNFLFGIRAQDYLYIESLPFGVGRFINLKLEGKDFKRQVIDLGIFYDYDSIIEIPENYSGALTDLNFTMLPNAPDIDYFNVSIALLEAADTEGSKPKVIRFIDIKKLRNTKVSLRDLLDLADGMDTFTMGEAEVTIHKEFKPGFYLINGWAIRIIDEKPVVVSFIGPYYPGILEISRY